MSGFRESMKQWETHFEDPEHKHPWMIRYETGEPICYPGTCTEAEAHAYAKKYKEEEYILL